MNYSKDFIIKCILLLIMNISVLTMILIFIPILRIPIMILVGLFLSILTYRIIFSAKYRDIFIHNSRPKDMELIQQVINFYYHNSDNCSALIIECMIYLDDFFAGRIQKKAQTRYNLCIFMGKICYEAEHGTIQNNADVVKFLTKYKNRFVAHPDNTFGIIGIEDIKLYKN